MCLTSHMQRLRFVLFLVPAVISLAGCASSGSSAATVPDAGNVDASGQTVSSVPWNKPESWETQGQLSGMGGGH